MSSIVVAGDTSGSVTLQAPAVSGSTVLTLPAVSGTVMVNGPAFSDYASTNQALSAGVYTKVLFDTEVFDTNSNFTSSRFTPTIAGYYQVNTNIYASGATTNTQISFYKNGSANSTPVYISANYIMQGATDLIYCNGSTDYVEVYFNSQFASTVGGASGAQFVRFSAAMIRSA